jgi:D-mannonate dehydratase
MSYKDRKYFVHQRNKTIEKKKDTMEHQHHTLMKTTLYKGVESFILELTSPWGKRRHQEGRSVV